MHSNKLVFKVCSIKQITGAPMYINQNTSTGHRGSEMSRCIWLPQASEARVLLDKYLQDIDRLHHVVHAPSLPALIDSFYASPPSQANSGVVIFLLAIFATATHSWMPSDCERGLFTDPQEAYKQSFMWVTAVEDVLDIAHRSSTITVEGIQGAIISFCVVFNIEGFTRRSRSLWNMALSLSRELNLHGLDHPSNTHLANLAQTEIKRRVWWYLVASDWFVVLQLTSKTLLTHSPGLLLRGLLGLIEDYINVTFAR